MSIFDYFVSKSADEQERKPFSPTPYRKLSSALDLAAEEVKTQYPDDSETVKDFVKALKEVCKARYKKASGSDQPPLDTEAHFFLSKDQMRAYACLLPPENGGETIILEEFLDEMHRRGISYGILQEKIEQELQRGPLRIFLAARGTLPQAGKDGNVTELFPRLDKVHLEVQGSSQVDFSQGTHMQPIRKGTAICLIQPPIKGIDGSDVTGRALPCPQSNSACIPQGEGAIVQEDGQALIAGADGILYSKDGLFCVQAQNIINGDLNQLQEPLKVSGSLYIEGNVDGGAVIEASGNIVISGKLGEARATSVGGTIRVQQGISGAQGKTFLSAARQVQSPTIEKAEINAGTGVVAEAISNSTIHCDGTVYATGGCGTITGSLIRAGESILCLQVGGPAGDHNRFSVGYPPHSPESWNQLKTELTQAKSTIKKLWDNITDLRKKGTKISDVESSVLERLVEQRNLYIEKRESLTAELSILDEVLSKKSSGRIRCETLYPTLEVQIGRLTQKVTATVEACDIHVTDNRILLK